MENIIEELDENDLIKISEYDNIFKFLKKDFDSRLKEIIIKKRINNNEKIIIKQIINYDKNSAIKEILNAKKLLTINHNHIFTLLDYSCGIERQLCSKYYWINYIFDFSQNDLSFIYNEKWKFLDEFTDEDLLHILYQQVFSNNYLETRNLFHGNINLVNILIEENKGISKLSLSFKPDLNPILNFKINFFENKSIYISPNLFKMIIHNKLVDYNKNKEDVFALGWIILELGIMKSVKKIYNIILKEFNFDLFNTYIKEFNEKFKENILLVTTIENMLSFNENERDSFKNIYSKLPNYDSIIQYYLNKNS